MDCLGSRSLDRGDPRPTTQIALGLRPFYFGFTAVEPRPFPDGGGVADPSPLSPSDLETFPVIVEARPRPPDPLGLNVKVRDSETHPI